jgi:hypothetical protein
MSTRATYRFINARDYGPDEATLYIHHDGYPSGAASYLYNMLIHPNRRGFGVEAMLRANDGAELTESHDAHGDTEYRYDVTGNDAGAQIVARARSGPWARNAEPTWKIIYSGTLAEFIDEQATKNAKMFYAENYSAFRLVEAGYGDGKTWHNRDTAARKIGPNPDENFDRSLIGHMRVWHANGVCKPGSANWDIQSKQLRALTDVFPELITDEIRTFLDLSAVVTV